jgi:hypothetical protein
MDTVFPMPLRVALIDRLSHHENVSCRKREPEQAERKQGQAPKRA